MLLIFVLQKMHIWSLSTRKTWEWRDSAKGLICGWHSDCLKWSWKWLLGVENNSARSLIWRIWESWNNKNSDRLKIERDGIASLNIYQADYVTKVVKKYRKYLKYGRCKAKILMARDQTIKRRRDDWRTFSICQSLPLRRNHWITYVLLAVNTRRDKAYAVNTCARFGSKPTYCLQISVKNTGICFKDLKCGNHLLWYWNRFLWVPWLRLGWNRENARYTSGSDVWPCKILITNGNDNSR